MDVPAGGRPVGYTALVEALDVNRPVASPAMTFDTQTRQTECDGWRVVQGRQAPEDTLSGHLAFALKHESLNLAALKAVFQAVGPAPIEDFVREAPNGIVNRRTWFLYEWLLGERLGLPDLSSGNYVDVLDAEKYHVADGAMSKRHRVRDNMGGSPAFCPLVRRTEGTDSMRFTGLEGSLADILANTPQTLFRRASGALLFGETKATFDLENARPTKNKLERWARVTAAAGQRPVTEQELTDLQRQVLDDGFSELGYRTRQNFIGSFDRSMMASPNLVTPRPEDVRPLMDGVLSWMREARHLDPISAAAAATFAFVYIHPLMDGNGRLHRYLAHHVLSERGMGPKGVILPISMSMAEKTDEYRKVLSHFDRWAMPHTKWSHNEHGGVQVHNDVSDLYRFTDMTVETEYLYDCVSRAVYHFFPREIAHLKRVDRAMDGISRIVDMSDDRMRDFLMFCIQEQEAGRTPRLPKKRAKAQFADVAPEDIEKMNELVGRIFGDELPPDGPSP
jgi:hypothetical protein